MKVKCINKKGWYSRYRYYKTVFFFFRKYLPQRYSGPKYNDIVTVESEKWIDGIKFYDLVEWPDYTYDSGCFVPLEEEFEAVTFSKIKEKASVN